MASLLSLLCGLFFGYDTGILAHAKHNLFSDLNINNTSEASIVIATLTAGGFLGAILSWPLTRFITSRKITLYSIFTIHIAGILLAFFSSNFFTIVAARLMMGTAIGFYSMLTPMYVAEITPSNRRGMSIFYLPLGITTGLIIGMSLSSFWHVYWRNLVLLNLTWVSIALMTLSQLPDSHYKTSSTTTKKTTRIDVWIFCIGLAILQQLTGINVINLFAPDILGSHAFWYYATNITFGLIGILLIDKVGRRQLMLLSLLGMSISLAALGLNWGWGFALTFIASFAIGMSGPPYIMPAELFVGSNRELGVMSVSLTSWLTNSTVMFFSSQLLASFNIEITLHIFAICCAIGFLFIWIMAPETRGLSLTQIEQRLNQSSSLGNL